MNKKLKEHWLETLSVVAATFGLIGVVIYLNMSAIQLWLHANWIWIVGVVVLVTSIWWVVPLWKAYLAISDHLHVREIRKQHVGMLASVTAKLEQGFETEYHNQVHGVQLKLRNPYTKANQIKVEEVANQQIEGPKEVIPKVIPYGSIADQIPSDRSLLGIYPETGNLEIVEPERYKTAWFVGGSNTGKTNTVYGKVSDAVRWGAKIIIADNHAFKKDSLANKLKDFHGRLLIPIAQTDEQIKDAIIFFLREFKRRRDQGKPCTEKWLLVADEVNATANHTVRISKEEATSLLEEFGIKIEGEFVKLQVFFKLLAETCGYEARGFEMFGYFISQKVAGLHWLRNAMMTVFVHGLLMDSEALLAANNNRKHAEMVKAFKVGRTLVYGLDFDPVVLQQPKYEIAQIVESTVEEPTSNSASILPEQADGNLVYFKPHQKRIEAEIATEPLQAQKNEGDEARVTRVTHHMIEGKSVNKIIKEEWGLDSGGGAYQVALSELREIQKIIASRAFSRPNEAASEADCSI